MTAEDPTPPIKGNQSMQLKKKSTQKDSTIGRQKQGNYKKPEKNKMALISLTYQ